MGNVDFLGLDVELQIARDVDPAGIGNKGTKSVGVLLILDAEEIESREKLSRQRGENLEAAGGARRDLAADEDVFSSGFFYRSEKIRPKIAFDEEKVLRLERFRPPADDPGEIEG